jgi:hypothetical protein
VISVNAPLDSQTITLEVQSEGNCPLTVSLNYLTILEATYSGTTAGEIRATPFPAYGALTGLMVPQGTWKIRIDARAETPFYATFMFYVGIILFAGVIAYVLQQNSKR